MSRPERHLTLRIVVLDSPPGVAFAVQRGKDELEPPALAEEGELRFETRVRSRGGEGPPNLIGPSVRGPKGARFVYLSSGTLAGQPTSCWTRRAKVPLGGITWELLDRAEASSAGVLEARIAGRARDGGPACATVPLLDGGWSVATAASSKREAPK